MSKGNAPGRRRFLSLLRRLNRHSIFALHVVFFLVGGTWIWTLRAPTLDKRFDVLLWLAALCAHGLFVYFRRRIAILFHLMMFAAGNGAIWTTLAPIEDKIKVNVGWALVAGLVGVVWFRRAVQTGVIVPRVPIRQPEAPVDDVSAGEDIELDMAPAKPKGRRTKRVEE